MTEQVVSPGVIMQLGDQLVEVVKIIDAQEVLVKNTSNSNRSIVGIGDLNAIPEVVTVKDPNSFCASDSCDMDEGIIKKAKITYDVLVGLYEMPKITGEAIKDAKEKLRIGQASIYRKLKNFEPSLGVVGVLNKTRGRKLGSRLLDADVEAAISRAIDSCYKGKAASCAAVYEHAKNYCILLGVKPPSMTAVRSRINSIPPKTRLARKEGGEVSRQKYGARPGKKKVRAPLEIVQIDHTKVDVFICDEKERLPLCRPWLTLIIDLLTRVILGYYISIIEPSRKSIAMALTHAVFPKDKWLRSIGADGVSYPIYGKPKMILVDNAKEFRSSAFSNACMVNKIDLRWRPPGRKHYGGHIERAIGTFMGKVHLLPGTTMSNVAERGEYDSEKHSAMTLREFVLWFTREVAIYHERIHRGINEAPIKRWSRFFCDNAGNFTLPALQKNPQRFKIDFLPDERRSIQNNGIALFGNIYWDPVLREQIGKKDVKIKYDPCSMKNIWVLIDGDYVLVGLSDVTLPDVSLEEIKLAKLAIKERPSDYIGTNAISLADKNRQLIDESKKKTKKQRKLIEGRVTADIYNEESAATEESFSKIRPDYSRAPKKYNVED